MTLQANATIILDPNDPNFQGYPDGNSVFNAQCTTTDNYFYVYLSKIDPTPQWYPFTKVQCQGEQRWNSWQNYYDEYSGIPSTFLLEVVPSADCTSLPYADCNSEYGIEATPTPTPSETPTPSGTPILLSDIASNSPDILPVYAYMTAGDIAIILCLFVLIMLQLLMFFFRKNKI